MLPMLRGPRPFIKRVFQIVFAIPLLIIFCFWMDNFRLNFTRPSHDFLYSPYPTIHATLKLTNSLTVSSFEGNRYPCPPNLEDIVINERIIPHKPRPLDAPPNCVGNECGIEFVTYSTRCTSGLYLLAESLAKKNIQFTILGYELLWRGYSQRVRSLHDYLLHLPKDRIVVYTDAEDVAIAPGCTAQDIIDQYNRFNGGKHVILAGEIYLWPQELSWTEFAIPEQEGFPFSLFK